MCPAEGPRSVAVVVPTFRRPEKLRRLLQSLETSSLAPQEVVVVNNFTEVLSPISSGLPVRVIELGLGLNVSAARNAGWRSTHADACAFIDDDNIVDGRMLEAALDACRADPSLGLVGPVTYFEDGRRVWCGGIRRSRWSGRTAFLYQDQTELPPQERWATEEMPNAFVVTRVALDRTGGFDEVRFPFHYEEADFGRRLVEAGFSCAVVKRAAVTHCVPYRPQSLGDGLVRIYDEHGPDRLVRSAEARVLFHARLGNRVQQAVVTAITPSWWLACSFAAMRSAPSRRTGLRISLGILSGLLSGYALLATEALARIRDHRTSARSDGEE
jgi:GT2 family glycosyltransferase